MCILRRSEELIFDYGDDRSVVYIYFSRNETDNVRSAGVEVSFSDGAKKSLSFTQGVYDKTVAFVRDWPELPVCQSGNGLIYVSHYGEVDAKSNVRNYTVCFSKELCGPIWVAYPMHKYYTNGDVGRNEKWQYGPIIPTSVQPSLKSAYKPINSYSRGHMLASNDRQSSVAINEQTYYFTNMSPQIQNGFNGGIWKDLELNCHKMICSDTLYMVTGAHFANRNTTCEDNSKPAKK